ncbi:double-strand break repair protein AddB [Phenylobacterium sp.]|uniref:double-strand break repair protein AddB n=1 Tax=Phenylobacterium sp. TaxID=1871053 RepID=UPI002FDA7EB5
MSGRAFLSGPAPRWFSIPAHRPFVHDLAAGLVDALAGEGPEALSQAVVLTPTRRGARALADAFLVAAGGQAVLPPQIRPLGDLDAGESPFEPGELAAVLPAAIDPLRRRLELTRLVKAHEGLLRRSLDASAALELADALGGFLDSLQIEESAPVDRLGDLVSLELAEHWQVSRAFLETALAAWPARLAAMGLIDISERRVRLLRALADQWRARPPGGVLIAAGSTGTAPATADLLRVIAEAPRGAVVLPGLDQNLADAAWAEVDEQHPQGALRRLLARHGLDRAQIAPWPVRDGRVSEGRWRRRIINEALRPAQTTADWLSVIEALRAEGEREGVDPLAEGLAGLSVISARSEDEAAAAAALLLREALETPGRTAALVTPDQNLARRTALKLARWGVIPDTSVGASLSTCPAGVLAGLTARLGADLLDPVRLLGVLKHPLTRLSRPAGENGAALSDLERHGLRGARPADFAALSRRLAKNLKDHEARAAAAADLLARLRLALQPLTDLAGPAPAAARAEALARSLEALAADETGAPGRLWGGAGGEALASLLAGLMAEDGALPPVTAAGFADLLARLLAEESVRTGGATHPRLRILGAIEARLVRADRLILAGLEEGVWPQGAGVDPFLSRPMREKLGLPPPERRVGLAAHDFAQAACAPEVVLLHSERRDGQPAVKSRWLWRLETLARGARLDLPGRPELLDWARALDAAPAYRPIGRPAPRPPVAHRPARLAVTRIESLTRDPYAVWARDILKLYRLDRPDEPVEARARGTAIHAAFETFARRWPAALPPDPAGEFAALYLSALVEAGAPPEALAREQALAREAAAWVAELEAERRADGRTLHVEAEGALVVRAGGREITLTAKADRIETGPDGYAHILDYKTGQAPSKKMVETGFSPQLTLTAAIVARGGFPAIPATPPGDLLYLQVTGRKPAGKVELRGAAGSDSLEAAERALAGAVALLTAYEDPERAYLSRTAPQFVHDYAGDYAHLARVFEWSVSGEDGEGEG